MTSARYAILPKRGRPFLQRIGRFGAVEGGGGLEPHFLIVPYYSEREGRMPSELVVDDEDPSDDSDG